jgi:hypothetical protein
MSFARHVRVHHVDEDKDDPLLRDVLSQRFKSPSRSRRRRDLVLPDASKRPLGDYTTTKEDMTQSKVIPEGYADPVSDRAEDVQGLLDDEYSGDIDQNGRDGLHAEQQNQCHDTVAPATDSGYASLGRIQEAKETDEEFDDIRTVYTDNQELDVPDDVKEKLTSDFSSELIGNLQDVLGSRNRRLLSRKAMAEFLKEFSIRLRRSACPGQQKNATAFVRHYRQ